MITVGTALILLLFVGIFGIALGYLLRFLQMTIAKAQLEVNVRKTLNKARQKATDIIADGYKQTEQARQDLQDRLAEVKQAKHALAESKENITAIEADLVDKQSRLEQLVSDYQEKLKQLVAVHDIDITDIKKSLEQEIDFDLQSFYNKKQAVLESEYENILEEFVISQLPDVTRRTVRNHTSTDINISDNEIGKVIGRDGINIKSFERYAGVDLVVDDKANIVTFSTFDPKRRLIAKQAMVELLADGRINRERIHEKVAEVESRLETESLKLLRRGLSDLGLEHHPIFQKTELLDQLASLYWRHSYGQNQLEHSLEVADIAGRLAEQLSPKLTTAAKLAGLLHDIGKTSTVSSDHLAAGKLILTEHQVEDQVVSAIMEHHQPHASSLLAALLQTADALSSGRPGARVQSSKTYLSRLENIENFIKKYDTVDNVYAVSGGREIQILITNHNFTRNDLIQLATTISRDLKQADLIHTPTTLRVIREDEVVQKVA